MLPGMKMVVVLGALLLRSSVSGAELEEQFWAAARQGDVESVKAALTKGVDVNAGTEYGATALSFACDKGHVEVARLLIEHGADVNSRDSFYRASPLSWATMNEHAEIVELLLKHGADGADQTLRGAVTRQNVAMVRAVLRGADISVPSLASAMGMAAATGNQEIIDLLAEAGATAPQAAPGVSVPREVLNRYAGSYRNDTLGMEFRVTANEADLTGTVPGQPEVTYRPANQTTFESVEFPGITIEFKVEDDNVTGLVLQQSGRSFDFKPVPTEAETSPEAVSEPAYVPVAEKKPWPSFRGTRASGNGDGQHPPLSWNAETGRNIQWKKEIPGLAHSSPVVWGDRVFVTTAISSDPDAVFRAGLYGDVAAVKNEPTHTWKVYCLDKDTGRTVWEQTAHEGVPKTERHTKASHANCTPAVDDKHLVVPFASEGLYCYDHDGKPLWKLDLGVLDSGWFYDPDYSWGFSSSPVIFEDRVIVQADLQKNSFIAAYSLEDGAELWRTPREEIPSWGTPTIYEDAERPQVITNSSKCIYGYDLRTGKELWRLRGNSEVTVGTPVTGRGLLFFTGGYTPIQPIYAVKAGATGDITLAEGQDKSEHVAWSKSRGGTYMPTPLVYGNHLYTCANNGILTCYEATTGNQVFRARIADGRGGGHTASPIAADGRLYLASEDGGVFVVKDGHEYELLATNPMGDVCMATPAISDGMIFVRTQRHLFGIAHPDRAKTRGQQAAK